MSNPHPVGSPVKFLDADAKKRFLDSIAIGASFTLSCNHAGWSYSMFRIWMNRGQDQIDQGVEKGDIYFDFYKEVNSAVAKAANRWLNHIERAAEEGAWQAAAWKLERRHPEDYSKDKNIEKQLENAQDQIAEVKDLILKNRIVDAP